MKKERINSILFLSLAILFIAPSRFFSLGLYIESNHTLFYGTSLLNFSIFYLLFFIPYLLFGCKNNSYFKYPKLFPYFFIVISIVTLLTSFFRTIYFVDLFSFHINNIIYLLSGLIICSKVNNKTLFYSFLISSYLLILLSPLSIILFAGNDEMYRAGTMGFGPNDLGWISSTLILFVTFSTFKIQYKIFIYILGLAGLLLSSSRAMIFLAFVVPFLYLLRKYKYSWLLISVIIFLNFLFIDQIQLFVLEKMQSLNYIPAFHRMNFILANESYSLLGDINRTIYAKQLISNLLDNPMGYGSILEISNSVYQYSTLHAHNYFLETLALYGIFLGLFIIFIIYIPIAKMLFYNTSKDDINTDYNFISLIKSYFISICFFCLFDYPFVNPKNIFIFMLFYSLSLRFYYANAECPTRLRLDQKRE